MSNANDRHSKLGTRRSFLSKLGGAGLIASAGIASPEAGAAINGGSTLIGMGSMSIRPFSGSAIRRGVRVILKAQLFRLDGASWGLAGIPCTFAIGGLTYANEQSGYTTYANSNGLLTWDFSIGSFVSTGNKVVVFAVNGAASGQPLPYLKFRLAA